MQYSTLEAINFNSSFVPLLARASLNNGIFFYRRYGCTPNFTTKIRNMAKQGSLKLHYQVLGRKFILTDDTSVIIFGKICYKEQLVAWHCFVASFGRCFAFFTLLDQLDPQQKHLLRVEEIRRAHWLICRARANLLRDKLWVWWKTSNKAKICCSK